MLKFDKKQFKHAKTVFWAEVGQKMKIMTRSGSRCATPPELIKLVGKDITKISA